MEQLLCAAADTIVLCLKATRCSCGRGMDSGFVSAIVRFRDMYFRDTITQANNKLGANASPGANHTGRHNGGVWTYE